MAIPAIPTSLRRQAPATTILSALLAGFLWLAATALPSHAAPLDDALKGFTTDSYSDTIAAVEALAASGAPQAATLLAALADRRLMFSAATQTVFYKDEAGKTFEAATGAPAAGPPADLADVRLNNRVRGVVSAVLGGLTLRSPDPAKRLDAAQSLFKSRDAARLADVQAAIAAEKDTAIRRALREAQAAILIAKPDATDGERLEAIATLKARGDQDALTTLRLLPSNASPAVREAAGSATGIIEHELALWAVGQTVWYGLSLGSVLLLAAIGLAITFGVMGVINMAHGEMVMLGAYTTFVVQEFMRQTNPALLDYSLAIAVPLAFLVAGAVGVAIERGVIRFLYGRPLETLLATWGISLILQQAVRTIFGPTNREVSAPSFMTGTFKVGELAVTWNRLIIILFAAIIFVALLAALRFTSFGLHVRAVTQNRRMASAMGIPTARIDALTFGLGSGIAGLAGVALSQIDNVSPNLGQSYIVDSFLVVVFGGVGNLWGTLVGALSLGLANKLLEPYAGAVLGKIVLLIAIILFIQKRPRGLFALKGRAVEA